jgi:hypothetical protein
MNAIRFSVIAALTTWLLVSAASAQRRDDVSPATRAAIDRAFDENDKALIKLEGKLDRIGDVAADARDEVRGMRTALWGMASALIISLLMQAVQIRKSTKP